MAKTIPDNHKPKAPGMIIVRRYEAANDDDLSARVKLVFTPWIENLYKSEEKDLSIEISEVTDEQSRSIDTSINSEAA